MPHSLSEALLWVVIPAAFASSGDSFWTGLRPGRGERRRRLRTLATLLRAADPATRLEALERAHALPPAERAALSRRLRRELVAGHPQPAQAVTTWFIRQILALLEGGRPQVLSLIHI